MRDLIYYVASTLDGFIAHHDGSFDGWPWDDAYGADLSETFPDTIPAHRRTPASAHAANKWFDKSYPSGHVVLYYRARH